MIQSLSASWDAPALVLALQSVQAADDDNDVWSGWGSVILVVGGLALAACLIGLIIWQVFRTAQAKLAADAVSDKEGAYRQLAEESAAAQRSVAEAQRRVADQQARIAEELAELRARLTAVETLLKEVG